MDANDLQPMSPARIAPPLRCEVTVSKRFMILTSAAHLGALAVAVVLTLIELAYALLGLAVVASWVWTLVRHVLLRAASACIGIEMSGERGCVLRMRDGRHLTGEIAGSSRALPWLIVLHVVPEGRKLGARVVLFADSLTPDAHRRMRARLRWTSPARERSEPTDASL